MELDNVIEVLFSLVLMPLIPLVVVYLSTLIKVKTDELKNKIECNIVDKYVDMASETLQRCVQEVSQVYVEALKKEGKFDKEAQKIALQMAKESFFAITNEETLKILTETYGDYTKWIDTMIEAIINQEKIKKIS